MGHMQARFFVLVVRGNTALIQCMLTLFLLNERVDSLSCKRVGGALLTRRYLFELLPCTGFYAD